MCRPYLRNEPLSTVAIAAHQDLVMNPFILDPKSSMKSLDQVQVVKQNKFQLRICATVEAPMEVNPHPNTDLVLPLIPEPKPKELGGITIVVTILPPACEPDHDPNGMTSTTFPSPENENDRAQYREPKDDLETEYVEESENEKDYVDIQPGDEFGTIQNEDYYVELKKEHALDRGPSDFPLPLNHHQSSPYYDSLSRTPHYALGFNHDPGQASAPQSDTSDHPNNSSSSSLDHLLGISFLTSLEDQGDPNQTKDHYPRKNAYNVGGGDELDRNDLDILGGFLNEESQLLPYPTVPEFSPTGVMDVDAHKEVLRFQAHSALRVQENVLDDPVSTPPDTSNSSSGEWNFFFDLFRMSDHQSISPQLKEEIELLRRRSVQQSQYHRPSMSQQHQQSQSWSAPAIYAHPAQPPYNTALSHNIVDSMNPKYNFPSSAPISSSSSSTCSSPAPSCTSSSTPPPAGGFYDIFHPPSSTSSPLTSAENSITSSVKKNRRLCQHLGCLKRSRSQGLCITHGGGKRCRIFGCNKSSQGGDLCIRHGGGKRCEFPACPKAAQTNGKCKSHGGGPRCKIDGCDLSSQGNGLCRRHGGGRRCAYMGCTKGTQRGEFCAIHGGSKLCSIDGCHRNDRGGGFCANHGGGRRCAVAGCKKPSRRQGRCSEHLRLATTTSLTQLQNSTDA